MTKAVSKPAKAPAKIVAKSKAPAAAKTVPEVKAPVKAPTKSPLPIRTHPAVKPPESARVPGKTPAPMPVHEPDPKTKAIVLGARKRKHTPAIFKIRSRKNTPIVFTLDDVRELIKSRKADKEKPKGKNGETEESLATQVRPEVKPVAVKSKEKPPALKPRKSRMLGAASLADILGVSSPPKTHKPISIAQMMEDENIPQKRRRYFKQLIEMREQIRQGLDLHTQETLKRSSKEDSGDLSGYSQHMADAGTDTFDRDFALSLVSSEQELLYEIEEALKRIRNGTYGICEITNLPISADRLAAVPFTRYSLEGQKELEKQRRYGAQRPGGTVGVFGEATAEDAAALAEDDSEG
jgi:RNA polymerase-binding transcription factor DksA